MRFKLGRTEVSVSFSFFALLLLSATTRSSEIIRLSLITSLLHECIHLIFILLFCGKIKSVRFSFMGGEIKRGDISLTATKEAVISLSAPVTNLLIGAGLYVLNVYEHFAIVNLIIGAFNLIPYEGFDGGRALKCLLEGRVNEKTANNVAILLSFIACFTFIALNGYLLIKNNGNILFLITSAIMLISLIIRLFSG